MQISPINLNPTIKSNLKHDNALSYSAFKYNSFFSFRGSQTTPLTDEDFEKAKEVLPLVVNEAKRKNSSITLKNLDLEKINGLQKDISVFDGLTMKEIGFVLEDTALLLNRGCANNCAHCAYSATPITNQTYDRMSYEDFKSFVDGVSELQKRIGDDVCVLEKIQPFHDSDCINIEIRDKRGNVYDYVDCVDYMHKNGFPPVLLDTSGWNPSSEKLQKRAEKFVDYLINSNDKDKVSVNVSINPYHALITESLKAKERGDSDKAERLEKKYVERMANVLYTFTPLIDSDVQIEVISRAIGNLNCVNGCNFDKLVSLQNKIMAKLGEKYKQDIDTEKKYILNSDEYFYAMSFYRCLMTDSIIGYQTDVIPIGRAKNLFKYPDFTFRQNKDFFELLLREREIGDMSRVINPNGSVLLNRNDLSTKTNVQLNFENKDREVKKNGNEISDFVYEV